MSNTETQEFSVGQGVNYGFNGDSYPGTVRKVSPSGKTVWVSDDSHTANPDKTQGPTFTPKDEDKPETWTKFTYRAKSGGFCRSGSNGWYLAHGRLYERNPSF